MPAKSLPWKQACAKIGATAISAHGVNYQAAARNKPDLTNAGVGGVNVRVPSEAAFDVDAHTSSGHISSSHSITAQTIGRGELRGKVGQGGVRLELRTGSGNIQIE